MILINQPSGRGSAPTSPVADLPPGVGTAVVRLNDTSGAAGVFTSFEAAVASGAKHIMIDRDGGTPEITGTVDLTGIYLSSSAPGRKQAFIYIRDTASITGMPMVLDGILMYGNGVTAPRCSVSSSRVYLMNGAAIHSFGGSGPWLEVTSGIFSVFVLGASSSVGSSVDPTVTVAAGATFNITTYADTPFIHEEAFSGAGKLQVRSYSHARVLSGGVVADRDMTVGTNIAEVEITISDFGLLGMNPSPVELFGYTPSTSNGSAPHSLQEVVDHMARAHWASYTDGTYPTTSLNIASGVRTKLTIDGASTLNTALQGLDGAVAQELWDTATNKITPELQDHAYIIRLNLDVERNTSGNDEVIVDLDIGGAQGIIAEDTKTMSVSGPQTYSFIFPVFTGATFIANGGELYVTPQGGDIDIHAASIFIVRL